MNDRAQHRAVEALAISLASALNKTADDLAFDASKWYFSAEDMLKRIRCTLNELKTSTITQYEKEIDEVFAKFIAC